MPENTQDAQEPIFPIHLNDAVQGGDEQEPTFPIHLNEAVQGDGAQTVQAERALDPSTPQAEQPTEGKAQSPEDLLPPEAQGETNGGPLGCCLGMMVGLLLSLSLAVFSRLYADPLGGLFQGNYGLLGLLVRILMGLLAFGFAIFLGSVGWKLGKRFYREYEPPVVKRRARRPRARRV